MLTLGIETSGRTGAVALCRDGECLDERLLDRAGGRHAQTLLAEIDALLRKCGLRATDCDVVAVSIGPGSFTGLRIGVVCAKTLAYATGCQLAAVDTFLCIAENSPADVHDLFVVGDAQRGELYVGGYRRESNHVWRPAGEISIVDGETWCRALQPADVVTGPGVERFAANLSSNCRVLDIQCRYPRAAAVARLGEQKMRNGRPDDLWSLVPFYLRQSAAEEKWDAAHKRGEALPQNVK